MFKAAVEEALERLGDEDLTGLFTDILIEKTEEEKKPKKEQISDLFSKVLEQSLVHLL